MPAAAEACDYGALLAIFGTPKEREATMGFFPLSFEGHCIKMECPEDADNGVAWATSRFCSLSATGFPIERWEEGAVRAAFSPVGSVCCIDPLCLSGKDFSALRLVLKMEGAAQVPPVLLLHDAFADCSAEVRLRVVHSWSDDDDGNSPLCFYFDAAGGGSPPRSPGAGHRPSRMDDIDDVSMPGDGPPPTAVLPPPSSVINLWGVSWRGAKLGWLVTRLPTP
jgi:hypothetical protein